MAWYKECCKSLLLELHYSKLCFSYHNWKAFTYTPWLPYRSLYQAFYLCYRWLLTAYFLSWLLVTIFTRNRPGDTFFLVYLTYWTFVVYNAYLLIAAISTTAKYLSVHFINPLDPSEFSKVDDFSTATRTPPAAAACCGSQDDDHDDISWYQKIQWFFYVLGNGMSLTVLVLYWTADFNGVVSDLNAHLVSGVFALVDLWVSGVPVNLLHSVYLACFIGVYVSFTGVYFGITHEVIYRVLDYEENLALAATLCVLSAILFAPLLYIVAFYLQYLVKFRILRWLFLPSGTERIQ